MKSRKHKKIRFTPAGTIVRALPGERGDSTRIWPFFLIPALILVWIMGWGVVFVKELSQHQSFGAEPKVFTPTRRVDPNDANSRNFPSYQNGNR